MRRVFSVAMAFALAACAGPVARDEPAHAAISVVPDRAENPRTVRFEVPTALVMGLPGDAMPNTLQARISTRDIATRELAAANYCPRGFSGPEGLVFPGGDRSRTVFTVRCMD